MRSQIEDSAALSERLGLTPYDFEVTCEGSIYLLRPLNDAAGDWISEHIPDDAQTWAGAVVVEHRYIGAILEGLASEDVDPPWRVEMI